MSTFNII